MTELALAIEKKSFFGETLSKNGCIKLLLSLYLVKPSATFAGDYLTNNPDVASAVYNTILHCGFEHFLKAGFAEERVGVAIDFA